MRGIVFIAMGKEYDRLAAHTVAYSRKFISCPVTVISNVKERDPKWQELPGINFLDVDIPTEQNRQVKIELYKYTPYDETLYMDVDAIITKTGIEKIFDLFGQRDIVLQHNTMWKPGTPYSRIYRDTVRKFGLKLPIHICLGGFWAFRKTPETIAFFEQWLKNWIETGRGRDMPSLACALKQTGLKYSVINREDDKLFSFSVHTDCVAIHRVKKDDLEKFGIPVHKQNKPFDNKEYGNWDKVYLDREDRIKVEPEGDIVSVKNGSTEVFFSKKKGGTIRKVVFDGKDSGMKRAGCEYWSNGVDHFEQEYGQLKSFIIRKENGSVFVETSATVVSPQLKIPGGHSEMIIEINAEGKIISKARLFPTREIQSYDQYYCFNNEIYTDYAFHGNGKTFNKIGFPKPDALWWLDLQNDKYTGVIVKSPALGVSVSTDKKLTSETGIHVSRSMMEIKCKDFNPARVSEYCEMVFEKV